MKSFPGMPEKIADIWRRYYWFPRQISFGEETSGSVVKPLAAVFSGYRDSG